VAVHEIRRGARADLDDVLELWARAGAPPSPTDTVESLERLLDHDAGSLLLAHAGGALVGSLIAVWNGWRGSFFRLAVDPSHRRAGIASALVREGERRLRARGALRLDAIVAADDPVAIALWQALGYERQQDRARFVRNFTVPGNA
jgi:ribosomal protein S18 acetylase RimI-like enzyme